MALYILGDSMQGIIVIIIHSPSLHDLTLMMAPQDCTRCTASTSSRHWCSSEGYATKMGGQVAKSD